MQGREACKRTNPRFTLLAGQTLVVDGGACLH